MAQFPHKAAKKSQQAIAEVRGKLTHRGAYREKAQSFLLQLRRSQRGKEVPENVDTFIQAKIGEAYGKFLDLTKLKDELARSDPIYIKSDDELESLKC